MSDVRFNMWLFMSSTWRKLKETLVARSASDMFKGTFKVTFTLAFLLFILQMTTTDVNYKDFIRGSLPGSDSRVIEIVRDRYLTPPSSNPYNLSTDQKYLQYSKSVSWKYIDHYLKQFFINQRKGFFVEAGALDGEFLSNSLWLEQSLGWSGLLVEPDEESYLQILQKHRKAWSSNSCLSPTTFPREAVHVAVKVKDIYPGVPWYYRGASHELGVTLSPRYDGFFEAAENSYFLVHCFPLESYLRALNVTTVDFLSLDIQGSEQGVLKSFPWRDIIVRMVVAELPAEEKDMVDFMEDQGYFWLNSKERLYDEEFIFVRNKDFFIHYRDIEPNPGFYQMAAVSA
ncbi:protein Star-like [Palaemon carinicauda]|uniref:protein Star-like n=1 Tax=Palaemon carinicauda TaxID=392227 RepID=UPI0035B66F95